MAAAAPPSDEECPVCHDDFTDPKILPCTHLVCRKCVLSWLHNGGNQAGCPLCRASILPHGCSGQDVAALVDDLPTDIITKAAVESRRVLNEKHVCVCDGTTKATSFCMQCSIKFCPSCCKVHKVIPATREHEIKQIAALTVDKLAASYQSSCAVHPGRQVEQFCSSHQELICINCSTSTHRRCPDVEGIAGAAMVKRQRLKEQEKELDGKMGEIQTQVFLLDIAAADGLAKFKAMKDDVKRTFEELRGILDKRCRDATADIQKKEDEFLKYNKSQKSDLEKLRARSAALCSTVSRLASASDDPLLAMLVKVKSRLEDAELLCMQTDVVQRKVSAVEIGNIFFDPQSSASLKKLIDGYGKMRYPNQAHQVRRDQTTCDIVCLNHLGQCSQNQVFGTGRTTMSLTASRTSPMLSGKFNASKPQQKEAASMLANMVEWCYLEVTTTGTEAQPYAPRDNHIIETAFRDKKKTAQIEDQDKNVYIIDFDSMMEYPKGDFTDSVCVIRRDKIKDLATGQVPDNWEKHSPNDTVKLVLLAATDAEYQTVVNSFQLSVGNVTIVAVSRIQNPHLYRQYSAKKSHLEKQNPYGTTNEKSLWHGTSSDAIPNIFHHGFNRSFCGKNATVYGQGVYFAVNSNYSASPTYSPPDPSGTRHVYLCKVLVGVPTVGNRAMRVLPMRQGHILYDSAVDNVQNPSMYVIFNDTQAYPEYLIDFK